MRTYSAAVAYAEKQHVSPSPEVRRGGMCQWFSRNCVGAAAFGGSAIAAWNSIPAKHRHTGAPIPGSIAYWRGGSQGYGHAAFAVENHLIWSTDIERAGHVDKVHYERIHDDWHQTYLGYIVWTPSGTCPTLPAIVAKPVVHLSKVVYKATNSEILRVQKALNAEPGIVLDYSSGPGTYGDRTKAAVKLFQHHLGFSGSAADGIIGITSLTELAKRHGFLAAP